jgi:hypothetical protein
VWYLTKNSRKETRLKYRKLEAVSTFQYGRESSTFTVRDVTTIKSVQRRYMRTVEGCTRLDHIRNENVWKELTYTHTKKSGGVKSGEFAGHGMGPSRPHQ